MLQRYGARLVVRVSAVVAAATLACGPEKPGSTEASDASGTTDDATSTTAPTSTAAPTTGGTIVKCADAKTEAECAMATETEPDVGRGCRWGELRVATIPQDGMCSLEVIGGVCELATFDEGGPGCFGFFREGEGGVIELVEFGCGSPANEAWQACWNVPMDSPGFSPCACLNPDG